MPLVKTLQRRGATIVVVAHAETLFAPGGPIPGWTRSLSNKIKGATAQAAPSNRRPRWDHYGLPLKRTIRSNVSVSPMKLRADFAVGSTAHYAAFVDQGTGVFNGSSPWEAKVLPPHARGAGSLYEHTWYPPSGSKLDRKPVAAVQIVGQEPQHFFDRGLKRGLAAMRVASVEIPGDPAALKTFPDRLANFVGATPNNAAFRAQLKEWRAWRDEAFARQQLVRRGGDNARELARREAAAERKRTRRDTNRAKRFANSTAMTSAERGRRYRDRMAEKKGKAKPKRARGVDEYKTIGEKRNAAIAIFLRQNKGVRIIRRTQNGLVVQRGSGPSIPISWESIFQVLPKR